MHHQARKEIKQQIKAGVPENQLYVISMPVGLEKKLEWLKSNEFRYKGSMYDVIRKEIRGGKIYFHCINDVKEAALFKDLDHFLAKTRLPINGKKSYNFKVFVKNYLISPTLTLEDPVAYNFPITLPIQKYELHYKEVISPPPRFA